MRHDSIALPSPESSQRAGWVRSRVAELVGDLFADRWQPASTPPAIGESIGSASATVLLAAPRRDTAVGWFVRFEDGIEALMPARQGEDHPVFATVWQPLPVLREDHVQDILARLACHLSPAATGVEAELYRLIANLAGRAVVTAEDLLAVLYETQDEPFPGSLAIRTPSLIERARRLGALAVASVAPGATDPAEELARGWLALVADLAVHGENLERPPAWHRHWFEVARSSRQYLESTIRIEVSVNVSAAATAFDVLVDERGGTLTTKTRSGRVLVHHSRCNPAAGCKCRRSWPRLREDIAVAHRFNGNCFEIRSAACTIHGEAVGSCSVCAPCPGCQAGERAREEARKTWLCVDCGQWVAPERSGAHLNSDTCRCIDCAREARQ